MLSLAQLSRAEIPVHASTTPEGIRFGWIGDLPTAPAPTVFFLGGGIEDSFGGPEYPQAINIFGAGVLCVSIDLPGHGAERRDKEPASIRGWRYRLDRDEDVAADLARRGGKVLDHLIAKGYTDPLKIALFGTSRGGFMAFHFAAADSRVRHVAGFAPVTDLLVLREFQDVVDGHQARALSCSRLADRLYDRRIFIIIGSTDYRVGTHQAIQFMERVTEAAAAHGQQPRIELHVEPSDGHGCPDGSYSMAARWLVKQWNPVKQ